MSLRKLTNQNLHTNLKSLVSSEREILTEIILHIIEVERRRLYLTFGFSSLFEYLTKSLGYSNGSAQRRIDAARLSFDTPEVLEKLESGEINLAQVSLLQKSIRDVQVSSKIRVDAQTKETLIEQLSNRTFAESEVLVAQGLNIQPKVHIKSKHQKDESVRLEITFSKTQWQKLVKMRELVSNSLPNGSNWDQVLEYVAGKVIQQKDKSQNVVIKKSKAKKKEVDSQPGNNAERPAKPARKSIAVAMQRKIFQRDQCCQYQDRHTGKQCESKWRLNIDHIQPVWAGGNNELENLRILCRAHNQELYRQQANLSQS